MDKKLKACLENNHDSYILPFLWLHGESKERVKEEILAIKNSCIREFDIEIKDEGDKVYRKIAEKSNTFDISAPDKYPEFSGTVRYTASFFYDEKYTDFTVIDLGQVGEVAEVYLNGTKIGTRINAPYKFSMKNALKQGENNLEIIVTSNLGHRRRDLLSTFIQIPPTGIVGEVPICRYN